MYCQIYPIPGGVGRSNARILFPARHALHKVHANENEEQPRKPALPQSRTVFADRYRRSTPPSPFRQKLFSYILLKRLSLLSRFLLAQSLIIFCRYLREVLVEGKVTEAVAHGF